MLLKSQILSTEDMKQVGWCKQRLAELLLFRNGKDCKYLLNFKYCSIRSLIFT